MNENTNGRQDTNQENKPAFEIGFKESTARPDVTEIYIGEYTLEYYTDDYSRCNTKEHFIRFLKLLSGDFALNRENGNEWANTDVGSYLECIAAWCGDHPYMQSGDPFVKDDNYVKNIRPFVDGMDSLVVSCVDTNGNPCTYRPNFDNLLEKESPWSIMARIFHIGKFYE